MPAPRVECQAALLVNPYDPEAVAAAIDQALSMPLEERRARHGELVKVLSENDIKLLGLAHFIAALTRTVAAPGWQLGRAAVFTAADAASI